MRASRVGVVGTIMALALVVAPATWQPDVHAGQPDARLERTPVVLEPVAPPRVAADEVPPSPESTTPAPSSDPATPVTPPPTDVSGHESDDTASPNATPTAHPGTPAPTSPPDTPAPTPMASPASTPDTSADHDPGRPTPSEPVTPSDVATQSPGTADATTAPTPVPSTPDSSASPGIDHAHADAVEGLADADVATRSAVMPIDDVLLVGADWSGSAVVQVRAGVDGTWSDWVTLVRGGREHRPDPGSAEAAGARTTVSDPVFVGGSDRVQFRSDGTPDLTGLLVHNEGGEGIAWTPDHTNSAAADAAPVIRTRKDWGADESLRDGRVAYSSSGTVRFTVVHHVGGGHWSSGEIANGCARADDWIRSIYSYHTQARGWWDIAYNFIVDPCGTIWEGRAGGIHRPVMGSHAGGFNDGSVGVLALGTFSGSDPDPITSDMVIGIEEVMAWKLQNDRVDPGGATQEVSGGGSARWPEGTEVTLPVLSAHQVSNTTSCPGGHLMQRLFTGSGANGQPRAWYVNEVRARMPAHRDHGPTHDIDHDGRSDVASPTDHDLRWMSAGSGGWNGGHEDSLLPETTLVGDFNGDGHDDVLDADGSDWRMLAGPDFTHWRLRSRSSVPARRLLVGDVDGDGRDDVFNPTGTKWRYMPGGTGGWVTASGSNVPASRLGLADLDGDGIDDVFNATGSSWRWMRAPSFAGWSRLSGSNVDMRLLRLGDVDADGRDDVMQGTGTQWRYMPGGRGGWSRLSTSNTPSGDLVVADVNGDGRDDVANATGTRWRFQAGPDFDGWRFLSGSNVTMEDLLPGDLVAPRGTDLLNPVGSRLRAAGRGTDGWRYIEPARVDASELLHGDFTGDGVTDVVHPTGRQWRMAEGPTFDSWLLLSGSNVGPDDLLVGDLDGDGVDDVFNATGSRWRYQPAGRGGWHYLPDSGVPVPRLLVGDLNADGYDDVFNATGSAWRHKLGPDFSRWEPLSGSGVPADKLLLGDVDGDSFDDVFNATGSRWRYMSAGEGGWNYVSGSDVPTDRLSLGDFDGDGHADVFQATGNNWRMQSGANFSAGWQYLSSSNVGPDRLVVTDP